MPAKIVEHDDGTATVVVTRAEWLQHQFTCENLHALFKADHRHMTVSCECGSLTEAEHLQRRMNGIMTTSDVRKTRGVFDAPVNMTTGSGEPTPGGVFSIGGQALGISLGSTSATTVAANTFVSGTGQWTYTIASGAASAYAVKLRYTQEQRAHLIARDLDWIEDDEELFKSLRFAKFCVEKMRAVTALDLVNGATGSQISEEDVAGFVRDVLGLDVTVTINGREHDSSGDGGVAGENILHQ